MGTVTPPANQMAKSTTRPLVAGGGHDRHGFARGEAAGNQALGQGP